MPVVGRKGAQSKGVRIMFSWASRSGPLTGRYSFVQRSSLARPARAVARAARSGYSQRCTTWLSGPSSVDQ